jgi:hypothetical protein
MSAIPLRITSRAIANLMRCTTSSTSIHQHQRNCCTSLVHVHRLPSKTNNLHSLTIQARAKRTLSNTKTTKQQQQVVDNIFGMRPIDYTILPPINHSPPPPPAKPGARKYIFPLSMVMTAFTVGYFWVNNNNDNLEFWSAMQSGEAVSLGGNDGEEEDDDDDDEEK